MTSTNNEASKENNVPEEDKGKIDSFQNPDQLLSATTPEIPSFGWSAYAERVNGRFAMIGFSAILLIEAITSETFLHWSGLLK